MRSFSKILTIILIIGLYAVPATGQRVRDLDITLTLTESGAVVVHEAWDINTGTGITEWYLVRDNLGDITIPALYVSDENKKNFEDVGEWNVNATLEEKAGKCGIVHRENGVELCWGVGSYGDHLFHPVYGMTRAVKALNDYDMLHLQVVSPGLSSPPEHVKVSVQSDDFQLDTLNTRIWGFGYEGTAFVQDGKAVFESDGQLDSEDSVIILLRFEKGLMQPKSVQERDFQQVLDIALKDSDYLQQKKEKEEDNAIASGLAYFLTALIFFFIGRRVWKILFPSRFAKFKGLKQKDISWYRDIPLEGKLEAADRILADTSTKGRNLPVAMILRMIYKGYIDVSREMEGPVKLSFPESNQDEIGKLGAAYTDLYRMLKQAAGENGLLEESEFSSWMRSHESEAYVWTENVRHFSYAFLQSHGLMEKHNVMAYTPAGVTAARQLLGLKQYLEDFTLSQERETIDVKLWKEYLVHAGLFGIADKVARQLKEINPDLFRTQFPYEYDTLAPALTLLDSLSRMVTSSYESYDRQLNADNSSYSGSRSGGGGGRSSHGGGGGFSGGGRGGGGR